MISFLISVAVLVAGYFIYGTIVERVFGIKTDRETPAVKLRDNVDFVPLPTWKVFLIQFLNIAGLGPIFGAISGAMFGTSAFIWIVLGSIFAGGVHDYLSGMLSVRHNGLSISEIVGVYLGKYLKQVMRVFTIALLIFVGTVFLVGPARIIAEMFENGWNAGMWITLILVYYVLSTLLPIDKIISKLYPLFGIAMLVMAVGLVIALFFGEYQIPEVTVSSMRNMTINPEETPLFPILFVTISCGAISGFHATQSPLMSRCIRNEKEGRKVFFGTMITEGILALIWAAAAMTFFKDVEGLNFAMADNGNNAAWAANEITNGMLGNIGGILAVIGLVAAPITSGDTAFRSARLILADIFSYSQKHLKKRFVICIPLFAIALILSQVEFGVIWRYFAWSNQTLAMVVLWTVTAYLINKDKLYIISFIPAVFMTLVCTTYILLAPEGFELSHPVAYSLGILLTILISSLFWYNTKRERLKLKMRHPDSSTPRPYDSNLVPSLPKTDLQPGLMLKNYTNTLPWISGVPEKNLQKMEFKNLEINNYLSGNTSLFEGYIRIPESGKYTFCVNFGQKIFMRLHDITVIDGDFSSKEELKGKIKLQKGDHPIQFYVNTDGNDVSLSDDLHLQWSYEAGTFSEIPSSVFFHQL